MEYIKSKLSDDLAKKIVGSQDKAIEYLLRLNDIGPVKNLKLLVVDKMRARKF